MDDERMKGMEADLLAGLEDRVARCQLEEPVGVLRLAAPNGYGAFSSGIMRDLLLSPHPSVGAQVLVNDERSKAESGAELIAFLSDPGDEDVRQWRHGFASMAQYRDYCQPFLFRSELAKRGVEVQLFAVPRRYVRVGNGQAMFRWRRAILLERMDPREFG